MKCEVEFKPDGIVKHFKNHPLVINAFKSESLSVLDVGCRVPCPLFVLFHDFNFTHLKGIELSSESEAVENFLKDCKAEDKNYNTVYDIYLNDLKFDEEDLRLGKQFLDETSFKKHFKILFNLHADWYFSKVNDPTVFDYVILSNVLHLNPEPKASEIFNGAVSKLKTGGLIFVRVNHNENPKAKNLNHRTYDDEEFRNLFKDFKEIVFCKDANENAIGNKSLIFFGAKK